MASPEVGFLGQTSDMSTVQTAAGTTQATASVMLADHVWIPSATEGQGVRLRPATARETFTVTNASSVNVIVYPPVGASLNGATTNDGLTLPAQHTAIFICFSATKFGCAY